MTADDPDDTAMQPTGNFPAEPTVDHDARLRDLDRLRSLSDTDLLDNPAAPPFNRAVALVKLVTGAPVALFSLVDDHRQFFAAQTGLDRPEGPICETPLSHSFCQHVVTSARTLAVSDAREHPMLMKNGAVRDLDVVAYLGVPVHGRRGQAIGSLCAIDSKPRNWSDRDVAAITQIAVFVESEIALRKHAAERELVFEELNHRVGNIFAIVNGLVRLGRREETTLSDYSETLESRIVTLAASHQLVMPLTSEVGRPGQDVALVDLVTQALAPYGYAQGETIRFQGDPVQLAPDAATYLALVVNELATNSVKHGALSRRDGALSLGWTRSAAEVTMVWDERFDLDVADFGARPGFGSKLLDMCIAGRLNGRIETIPSADGLKRIMTLPLSALGSD